VSYVLVLFVDYFLFRGEAQLLESKRRRNEKCTVDDRF